MYGNQWEGLGSLYKSRHEEMRNEKWEMRKWGNGKKIHYISLSKLLMFCYCGHQMWWESQSPSMHSLRDQLCLTVGTKGVCNTICKLILSIRNLSSSLTAACYSFLEVFVESVNSYFPTLYKESFWGFFMHLHCYGYTYICLILKWHVIWILYTLSHWNSTGQNIRRMVML